MKRFSISLVTSEMQIKTTVRYYFTSIWTATIKTENNVLVRTWRNWNPCALLVGL